MVDSLTSVRMHARGQYSRPGSKLGVFRCGMSVLRSVGSQRLALLVAAPAAAFAALQWSPPVVGLMAPRGRPMKTRPALATRNIAIIETVIDTAAMLTCDVRIHAKTRESKGRFSAGGGGGLSVKQQSHRELTVISRESSAALNLRRLRSPRLCRRLRWGRSAVT